MNYKFRLPVIKTEARERFLSAKFSFIKMKKKVRHALRRPLVQQPPAPTQEQESKNDKQEPAYSDAKKKFHVSSPVFYSIATLVFVLISFLILSVIPKSTVIDMNIFSRTVQFTIPPEIRNIQRVSLLHSSIWAKSVKIENFRPITLSIDSFYPQTDGRNFINPLKISPKPLNGRVTFYSSKSDISVQEVFCYSASKVSLRRQPGTISFEIKGSTHAPVQKLSFNETVGISVQECTVTDAAQNDFTAIFRDSVMIKLQVISNSLNVLGEQGELDINIETAQLENATPVLFMTRQIVRDLDFSKRSYESGKLYKESTIDSITTKRNFPLEDFHFNSEKDGSLALASKPSIFEIGKLTEFGTSLRIQAHGRFKSFKIGQGAVMRELVPEYLSFITENPKSSVFFTSIMWMVTIAGRLFTKNRIKSNN